MDSIPVLPLLKITQFLEPRDIVRLSLTCKRFYDLLPRFVEYHGEDFILSGPHDGNRVPQIYFKAPVLCAKVKRFKSSVTWRDQGWGNRKGRIIVELRRGTKKCIAEKDLFGVAEHEETESSCCLFDDPVVTLSKPGDYYKFIRDPGGGGGHKLYVNDFTVLLELDK